MIGNTMTILEKRVELLKLSREEYDLDHFERCAEYETVDAFNNLHNLRDHEFYDSVMELFGEIAKAAGYIQRVARLKKLKSDCAGPGRQDH
jgi:hypothetical protein